MLEVGFTIDPSSSEAALAELRGALDTTETAAVRMAGNIERQTSSMIDAGAIVGRMSTITAATTRAERETRAEKLRTEQAIERLIGQIDRETAAVGRSREQQREARVEELAATAAKHGNTDAANRLTASLETLRSARDAHSVSMRAEADAATRLAREHADLVAQVRGSQAAQEADAAAAEKLRMATDPLYAATKRLNAEIAESTRLYHAGVTAPAEYARQQEVLTQRLRGVADQQDLAAKAGRNNAFALQSVAVQLPDVIGGLLTGQKPMTIFIQQGFQIAQVGMMAEGGLKGFARSIGEVSKAALIAVVTNPILLGLAATAGAVAGSIALMNKAANSGSSMKQYAASLGLTEKQIRQLDNVTVTYGDTTKAVFQVAGRAIWDGIGPAVTSTWTVMKGWLEAVGAGAKTSVNFVIGAFVGGFGAIKATWSQLPAALGDVFFSVVNLNIDAINMMVRKAIEGINWLGAQANKILPSFMQLPELGAPQIERVKNQYAGAAKDFGDAFRATLGESMKTDYLGNAAGAVIAQARRNAQDRIRKDAEKKGYLDPEKAKSDKLAERLGRENRAIEAQIRNLYALADAYGVSGAEALIAEARMKAESDAINKRGDAALFVNRQIRLEIAQRVSDATKATASLRDQAGVQERVNAAIASGLVPASQAADMVRDQIADLPLLAAVQAAQQRGLADEAARATQALDDQRAARVRLTVAESRARLNASIQTGSDRLAELREEFRLVIAAADVRERSMAEFRARQETVGLSGVDPAQVDAYVKLQGDIAVQTLANAQAQDAYNESLTFAADRWDLIARNVQRAGQGMADSFGEAGRALGDLASVFAEYRADHEAVAASHKLELSRIDGIVDAREREAAALRENARFALRTATMQVGAFGDAANAAKRFFGENTAGYRSMAAAEKAFRAVEFALSVRAMAQDAIETGSSILKSGARAAAHGVEAVAKAIASLPFPLNIAAGAATAAVIASLGIAIGGAFGGSRPKQAPTNTGTGTVFGDSTAQSESLKRAIDELKQVDTLTNVYSRQMLESLRSIDSQISGVAAVIVRGGDINASANVSTGFKPNLVGSVLGSIPLIGGALSGLFGTRTDVTGSGIYGGAQSIGSVLNGGFDAQAYSDVTKTKKFLGIVTGRSSSTTYGALDPALENQFTLILRSFNDAIKAAAVPLGESTDAIQQRLNGFVVNIGKIDLKGLTGEQIQEKLSAVFGAAADNMATAAFPLISQFQRVGEGAFETLTRVATTVEQVSTSLDLLGSSARGMSIAAKLGLADQFESVSALNDAATAYFAAYYTSAEQAAARTAQLSTVFGSLGLAMPSTLDAFRQLVEAQDLTTSAGQATYATLLKLAPAFADLQTSLQGAKSAADILSERQGLERQILELQGKTDEIRKLDLAKLDASNRALQLQVWAIQDAKSAATAAEELRQAWTSVGDGIMDEVRRIRGLGDATGANTFAGLMGRFNAATAAARGGDLDAAKSLPQLSQALLAAATSAATSRQELARVQAQTAASLEATYGAIGQLGAAATSATDNALLAAAATAQAAASPSNDSAATIASLIALISDLKQEVRQLRDDNNAGHAATAGNTGKTAKILDTVNQAAGGIALAVAAA
ncbi:hypothetical protein ATB93_18740 [Sphingomonas sp. WG]|nr:hypothetical protein ATB93_18740 [Sphingomonas sp. WG]